MADFVHLFGDQLRQRPVELLSLWSDFSLPMQVSSAHNDNRLCTFGEEDDCGTAIAFQDILQMAGSTAYANGQVHDQAAEAVQKWSQKAVYGVADLWMGSAVELDVPLLVGWRLLNPSAISHHLREFSTQICE